MSEKELFTVVGIRPPEPAPASPTPNKKSAGGKRPR